MNVLKKICFQKYFRFIQNELQAHYDLCAETLAETIEYVLQTYFRIWQYGLWSFQTGGTKLERFLPKNQHTQRKFLNFEDWINEGLRSFRKSEF